MTKEGRVENNYNQEDEISLKVLFSKIGGLFSYLLSKWVIIFVIGLLGSLLGYTYAYFNKPIYTATTTFVLEDESLGGGGLGSLSGLASIAGVDVGSGGGIFQGDNIFELYRSRKMVVNTLFSEVAGSKEKQLLVDLYVKFNDLRNKWKDNPSLKELNFSIDSLVDGIPSLVPNRTRDSVLNEIVNDITKNYLIVGKPDKKLSIIKVEVKSRNELFSKAFNEAIVKNVNYFYLQTKTKRSLENVQIMQRKTDSVRAVMNGAIYAAVAVSDATPNLNPTRQIQRVAPSQKAQFSAETNKAILSSLVQNLEMSKVSLMKETPLLELIDEPVYPLKKEKFGKVKGIILGGISFGFFAIAFLLIRRIIKSIVA
jgi:hypothetical protein